MKKNTRAGRWKCTKFDEGTPCLSEVKFNEMRREWKLRNGFFPSFGRYPKVAETSLAAPCGLWYESSLASRSRMLVGRSSRLRRWCSTSPSSLTTKRVPKEFAEGRRRAISYRTSTTLTCQTSFKDRRPTSLAY